MYQYMQQKKEREKEDRSVLFPPIKAQIKVLAHQSYHSKFVARSLLVFIVQDKDVEDIAR